VTARLIVMTVAIAFIYSLISSGRAPDGRDVAGIQQINHAAHVTPFEQASHFSAGIAGIALL
jgi:hypothetical protein